MYVYHLWKFISCFIGEPSATENALARRLLQTFQPTIKSGGRAPENFPHSLLLSLAQLSSNFDLDFVGSSLNIDTFYRKWNLHFDKLLAILRLVVDAVRLLCDCFVVDFPIHFSNEALRREANGESNLMAFEFGTTVTCSNQNRGDERFGNFSMCEQCLRSEHLSMDVNPDFTKPSTVHTKQHFFAPNVRFSFPVAHSSRFSVSFISKFAKVVTMMQARRDTGHWFELSL